MTAFVGIQDDGVFFLVYPKFRETVSTKLGRNKIKVTKPKAQEYRKDLGKANKGGDAKF